MSRNSMMNDILGQLLGGAKEHSGQIYGQTPQGRSAKGGLDDLLGSVLGGGQAGQSGSGGGLGGLLGGLLGGSGGAQGGGGLGGLLNKGKDMLSGPGGKPGLAHAGAAAAIGLLLGSGSARSMAGKGLVLGGLAYLGKMAYDSYAASSGEDAPAPDAKPVHELTGPEADQRGATMLAALIAAAKSDGHIDPQEQDAIMQAVSGLGDEGKSVLMQELNKPVDAREIAALADSDQSRREIYGLSVMITGGDDPKERAYLDELAGALGLSAEVKTALEQQARAAYAPA